LEKLIQAKSKGQEGVKQIRTEGEQGKEEVDRGKDLLEILKASLKTTSSSNKLSSKKTK
jgi:non-homologous end joining protein Ku